MNIDTFMFGICLVSGFLSAIEFAQKKDSILWVFLGMLSAGTIFSIVSPNNFGLYILAILFGTGIGSFTSVEKIITHKVH